MTDRRYPRTAWERYLTREKRAETARRKVRGATPARSVRAASGGLPTLGRKR